MAVILADSVLGPSYVVNPYLTLQVSQYGVDYWPGHDNDMGLTGAAGELMLLAPHFPVEAANRAILVDEVNAFGDDFYDRIYLTPNRFDLGTIASPQTRNILAWNAFRSVSANLSEITVSGTPVDVTGTVPYLFPPLGEKTYVLSVGVTGPFEILSSVLFDFSNVPDPVVVVVTGNRATRFSIVPEVPVREVWSWLTDLMVATDGTEQRVAVRGEVPRTTMELHAVFTAKAEIDEFNALLLSSVGRLWVPEYQYATLTTAASAIGALSILLSTANTDIRAGEYVLVDTKSNVFLAEVENVFAASISLTSPLEFAVPKGAIVAPGAPCLLDDGTGPDRYAVDDAAETDLKCRLQRYRTALMRPGVAAVAATYLGSKVLERRPLAPDLVRDSYSTGQEDVDNDTGVFDMQSTWDYTRVGGPRQYKVDRIKTPSEMDYWKEILGFCRGRARMFWTPTYRKDFDLAVAPPTAGTGSTVLVGDEYALRVWPTPTHQHLEFETAAGVHRVQVTSATEGGGNTTIAFTPVWPTGSGWDTIKRISLLLPVRLNSDEVAWDHYGLESILNLSIRTAEVQTS